MPNVKKIPITVGLARPEYVARDAITQGDVDAYELNIRLAGYDNLTGRAELRFVLPDGQTADREAEITEGNLITCMMDAPLYSQMGDLLCAVRLLDDNLFTPLFIIFKGVRSVPGDTELADQVQPYPVWAGEIIDRLEEGTAIAVGPPGKGLEFSWDGDKLGVRVEGETEYTKSQSLRGAQGYRVEYDWDGTSLALKLEDDEDFDNYVDLKGEQGDFWKPTVDAAGNISWTQAPGSSAPTSQNIKGPIGNTGKGVKSTEVKYATSASGQSTPSTWSDTIPAVTQGQFLWVRVVITYTDNETTTMYSIGYHGEKGDTGDTWKPTVSPSGDLSWAKNSGATAPTTQNIKGPPGDIDNLTALHIKTALGYTPADANNMPVINVFTDEKDGLVPKPSGAGETGKYLKGDGTWATPPDTNTTYLDATTQASGLMSKDDKIKLNGLPTGAVINGHINTGLAEEGGVHGFRINDEDMLQYWNGTEWVDIVVAGAGFAPLDCPEIDINQGDGVLEIMWSDPEDGYYEEFPVAVWEGTKLVRKQGSYPEDPEDGTLLVNNKVRGAFSESGYVDSGLVNGTDYYYALFPYSDKGQINVSGNNVIMGTPTPNVIYGVSIDLTNSNPETAVTYTDDAIGKIPGTAWDALPIFKDIKPCVLKDGVVQYYLNPNDFTKKAGGGDAVITGDDGDVMIEIPKVGVKIATVGNTLTVQVTDDPNAGGDGFKYYAHTRDTEGDRDFLYIGAYLGYVLSNQLRSISGREPTGSTTIGAFRTRARANNAGDVVGYDQVSFYPLTLLQCLFLIKYKDRDSQTALGRGWVDSPTGYANTGGANQKGMDFGEATGKLQMSFLGIEDFWGNKRWWIDGFFSNSTRKMLTAFKDFNDSGSGTSYTDHGEGAASDISGYMNKPQGTTETGFIAKEVSGSGTTHFADRAYLVASSLPVFGGYRTDASYAGAFFLHVGYSASISLASVGARLMFL